MTTLVRGSLLLLIVLLLLMTVFWLSISTTAQTRIRAVQLALGDTFTFTGLLSCHNFEAIRCADQYPGSDCGAKILAADADFANPKGEIWINRACGLTISTWQTAGVTHSLRWIEGGIWNVATTLTQQHGGVDFIGLGLTDGNHAAITGTGTGLLYTGTCGNDLLSILGQASPNRIDRVNIYGIRFDGNNCARYDVRNEKSDTSEIHSSRLANATECNFYAADATGIKMYNVDESYINKRALCLDWGTGGFGEFGGQVEADVAGSTSPFVLIEGASNNIEFSQVQFDTFTSGAFGGFIQVAGYATNSPLPGAPAGGSGSPTTVSFNNISTFMDGATAATQGAEVLVTGISGTPSQTVAIRDSYFAGGGVSPVAIKADFTNKLKVDHILSSGHTTGLASTVQATANTTQLSMWDVNSLDSNRTTGTVGAINDCNSAPSNVLSCSGAIQLTGGATSWLTLGGGTSDAAPPNLSLFFRTDLNRLRYLDNSAAWHSVTGIDTTDTLTNKTLNVPLSNGTGLQIFNTTTTCTTGNTVGAICTTAVISLPAAEADTNYRVVCTGKGLTNVPVVIGTTNSSASQFTITIAALTAAAASFSSYDCAVGHN